MEEHRPKKPLCREFGIGEVCPKTRVEAIIQAAQRDPLTTGEDIVEKQPNPRMCSGCGIENLIGLKLKF
jgi:hypothetical protein